jgi:hypothetical protein
MIKSPVSITDVIPEDVLPPVSDLLMLGEFVCGI